MVKPYQVKSYIKDGIEDNILESEDIVSSEIVEENENSIIVEFVDYSMNGNKSRYKITVESIG